jgi:hypothetical protein
VLRTVHNSFGRPDPFEAFHDPKSKDDDDDDAFHFIGYVPIADAVYELDGLKPGPIKIGPHPSPPLHFTSPQVTQQLPEWLSLTRHDACASVLPLCCAARVYCPVCCMLQASARRALIGWRLRAALCRSALNGTLRKRSASMSWDWSKTERRS